MRCTLLRFVVLAAFTALLPGQAPVTSAPVAPYFPPRHDWQRKQPDESGWHADKLAAAVQLAKDGETRGPRNMDEFLENSFRREPNHGRIGPVFDRGDQCGLVVHRGCIVAEWGDCARADMCNSISKTFLSTVVGLACQQGLIRAVTDRAAGYMPRGVDLFASEHNRAITWEHLLRQTSDWQGTLWGKADWEDRPVGNDSSRWPQRELRQPGTHYKYNDVRVNVLALAATHVWRRPLPEVLREQVMDPIGASSTWRWHGYDNSWTEIDGRHVQAVSGGGHWGGGMVIDAFDLARFGLLFLRDGRWGDRQIVSAEWIAMARTPGPANPGYGYCNWFLNTDRKSLPSAPTSAVQFLGNGSNIVYVDQDNDLVVVVRWIRGGREMDAFLAKLFEAMPAK